MWDLVPWAARWTTSDAWVDMYNTCACEPSTYMWVPLPQVGSQEKAVFSREHMVRYTYAHMRAQAARARLLSLACNSLHWSSWKSQNWVRSRHKSLNGRLKNCAMFTLLYCHDLMEHGNVFWAIAVIMQISINVGEKLFGVDYSD